MDHCSLKVTKAFWSAVVQTLDNSIGFASVYPLDSDLFGGQRYPSFEQLQPGIFVSIRNDTQDKMYM